MRVVAVDADDAHVQALLDRHWQLMRQTSPPDSCHVMDARALVQADAHLLAVFDGDRALGVGAITAISDTEAELKSMHTLAAARGRGVGRTILRALLDQARAAGYRTVSLETGAGPQFRAARRLYAQEGFEPCPPFGDYRADPFSVYMTRDI
ncbi:GNAT family N-acetyltransferase [Sedimentitalea sp. HM32M-2]|uniref:GNAT family N-acetyltransferase n=1 Tax=Sedimentitalea sp. HM32M-2 TaxID=3351566 RepID=UPI00362AEDE1